MASIQLPTQATKILANTLFVILLLASCDSKKAGTPSEEAPVTTAVKTEYTEFGHFPYQHHIRHEGRKPTAGSYVQYNYRLTQNGQEIGNSFQSPTPPIGILPSDEQIKTNPQPLHEALRIMSEGDSVSISTKGSSITDDYSYEIVLVKIIQ